jgi:hypothetical protein
MPVSKAPPKDLPPPGRGDAILHEITIERLRAGEPYYDAVGDSLRQRNYPAAQVFNWRTPAHFELVAALSIPVARTVLQVLAIASIAALPFALRGQRRATQALALLAMMGAVATAVRPQAVVVAEVWAGVFIALSLCAYYARAWVPAAGLGVAAVFFRELAAPYALACGLLAMSERRRGESAVWMAGGAAYLLYFAVHAAQVWAHQQPGDLSHAGSWLRWNGLAFTFATMKVSGWLGSAPHAVAVLYTAAGLASVASPRAPRHVTAPVVSYLALFAVAGQPFNDYWGWVAAPIWAFAAAHGWEGLRALLRQAGGRPDRITAP